MSNPKDRGTTPPGDEQLSGEDAALLDELGRALTTSGELLPLSEEEVERLEAELGTADLDADLPESLRQYHPPSELAQLESERPEPLTAGPDSRAGGDLIRLSERRPAAVQRSILSHLVALTVGAAAATALFVAGGSQRTSGGAPSSEPAIPLQDAGHDAHAPIRLVQPSGCAKGCCAGSACSQPDLQRAPPPTTGPAPGEALKQCSSGRTCVPCSGLDTTRYRVRTGALMPTDYGRKLMAPARSGQLELCFRAGSSREYCVDAHPASDQDQSWRDLGLVVAAPDLIGGLGVTVRWKGAERPLASWSSPIKVNPTLLCNGLSVRPKTEAGELIGVASVFLMDTHYVQLARAQQTSELEALAARYSFDNLAPKLFELSESPTADAGATARFALALGPFSEAQAEALRWQVLNQGGRAQLVLGGDYHGAGRGLGPDAPAAAP